MCVASLLRRIFQAGALLVGVALLVAACSPVDPGIIPDPSPEVKTQLPAAYDLGNVIFPDWQKNIVPGAKPAEGKHLATCKADTDCFANMTCVNLFSGQDPACFFKCDPKKGENEKQNPDCMAPENCIRLTDGSGICSYFPGQLYGIGSYKAVIRHKQDEKCLMRYGGCDEGLICVDTKRSGDFGICLEECTIPPTPDSKRKTSCKTPNTTCSSLVSGFAACLPPTN